MAKPWAKPFYNSRAWKRVRGAYIKKVFGICEHCGEPGYIADHIVELTPENINDSKISLSYSNLQYLCLECHNKKTFGKASVTREDVQFDDNGDLIQIKKPVT